MINLHGEAPELPVERAGIHEVSARAVSQGAMIELLQRLELPAPDLEWDNGQGWLTAGDTRVRVAMNRRSGGFRYTLRPLAEEPGRMVTASEQRLEEIARDFLDRVGSPDAPLRLERISYLKGQAASLGGSELSDVEILNAAVIFRRFVDDIPVVGPGGFAMVRIGTDGAVVGGREVWRPSVRSGPSAELRRPDDALTRLVERLTARGLHGDAWMRKALFGYEELGIDERQHRLAPCYAFLIEFPGEMEYKTVEVVPAIRSQQA